MAVRAILANPRYTGRQVWNRQRRDEVLVDVDDVALGHVSKMRWNDEGEWIYSDALTHAPFVGDELFGRARTIAAVGRGRHVERKRRPSPRPFALRGLISCAICGRLMQGRYNHGLAHYRCRYPSEYAVVNEVDHPRNVYLREDAVVGPLDGWLAQVFDPDNIDETLDTLHAARESGDDAEMAKAGAARKRLADCDRRLTRYRAALDSGADPAVVTTWIAEVQAERLAAEVELDRATGHGNGRLSREQLVALVNGLGNLLDVLANAAPEDKAEVYARLGLRLTYDPARRVVIAESDPWAKVSVGEPVGPKRPPTAGGDRVGESQCRRGVRYLEYTRDAQVSALESGVRRLALGLAPQRSGKGSGGRKPRGRCSRRVRRHPSKGRCVSAAHSSRATITSHTATPSPSGYSASSLSASWAAWNCSGPVHIISTILKTASWSCSPGWSVSRASTGLTLRRVPGAVSGQLASSTFRRRSLSLKPPQTPKRSLIPALAHSERTGQPAQVAAARSGSSKNASGP